MTYLHPRALQSLARYFPSSCTIQVASKTQDTFGAESRTWSDIPDPSLIAIPCAVGNRSRVQLPAGGSQPELVSDLRVLLSGHYSGITTDMRAQVDGVDYQILEVVASEAGSDLTSLRVSVVM